MCIYFGNDNKLTYETREHILPAALGCHTKLEKGVVSDQANRYFSPIERDVIEHSFIQMPRIIQGPGKRGKLSPQHATTSEVSVIRFCDRYGLGYMKGTSGFLLNQFIIDEKGSIQFHFQNTEMSDFQTEMETLKRQIMGMGEKYVPVTMPEGDENIYITFFKKKVHIGYRKCLSDLQIDKIKEMFKADFALKEHHSECGPIQATIEIISDFRGISILAAKSAINTLAFIKGKEYIINTDDFCPIRSAIFSDNDKILNYVSGISPQAVPEMRRSLHLTDDQQACILVSKGKKLSAWVIFYDFCFVVDLCNTLTEPFDKIMDGIVCDWKKSTDYLYTEYLQHIGIVI